MTRLLQALVRRARVDAMGVAMPGPRLTNRIRTIVEQRALPKISSSRTIGLVSACFVVSCALLIVSFARAQDNTTEDWEKAAGGKMSFEVASVKPTAPNENRVIVWGFDQQRPGGLVRVVGEGLDYYIGFAYKLDIVQQRALRAQMPPWARKSGFDMEARTPGDDFTTDQRRLMMQSFLAGRFKLTVHFETKDGPAYALVLAKAGKLGSQMHAYPDGFPCSQEVSGAVGRGSTVPTMPTVDNGQLPGSCGNMQFIPPVESGVGPALLHRAGRNISMDAFVAWISLFGNVDRTIVDRTGLNGTFDFSVEYDLAPPPGEGPAAAEPPAAVLLRAVNDQLGLKLESITAPVRSLVIDHIEQPEPN